MKTKLTFLGILLSLSTVISCAQDAPILSKYSFGVDEAKKLIVLNIDGLDSLKNAQETLQLDRLYTLEKPLTHWSNDSVCKLSIDGASYKLYMTKAPIIAIEVSDSLVKFPKKPATLRYYDADTSFTSPIGMSLRGNLSLTYPKKSFNVEFYNDAETKSKNEIDFKNLRKDDDFILDGLYNEPLFIRADFGQKLWKDIYTPHYAEQEPKARATVDGFYTDLFVNNEYRGVYFLSEKINRSLLKLKKKKEGQVRGELFKAASYQLNTSFKAAPNFKNSLPMWSGFEMKYPYEDYTAHYDDFFDTMSFTVDASPEDFAAGLSKNYVVENLIDYFLFVNLIRATDNVGKNYYIARYDAATPYFIVPWDMDGTLGTIQDGKQIPTTDDLLSNHLFNRLWSENTNDYRSKVITRWKLLRQEEFSDNKLHKRIVKRYTKLLDNKFYERDYLVWEKSHGEKHLQYMQEWLQKRLEYLDSYFVE